MFNYHRAILMAGLRLGIPEALKLIAPPPPPTAGISVRSKYRTSAPGSPDRLHPGRSSSVRKLQRWLNSGEILPPPPLTERQLLRHAWYRRQKEREARAAAKEAWNNDGR